MLQGVDVAAPLAPPASSAPAHTGPANTQSPGNTHNGSVVKPSTTPGASASAEPSNPANPDGTVTNISVDEISRGTYQPRVHFDPESLQELADSITAQGLIQPILLRRRGGGYELIAGERRWRAAQLAGLKSIPAIVREMDDNAVAAVTTSSVKT